MSLWVDTKFLNAISFRLKQFKKVKENLFKFRCPECGDSKKSTNKARGYIFSRKNDLYFKCHNCGSAHTFSNFLKTLDPNLHKKYVLERFANGENKNSNYKKPKNIFPDSKPKFASKSINLPSIAELPEKHFCRDYIEQIRKIPKEHLGRLYFAKDFQHFVDEMAPGKHFNLGHTPKLIIPFFDYDHKLFAFQARALVDDQRYITIKLGEDKPKIFGLERLDLEKPIYVLEGPLDTFWLPNAIAAAGSDLPTSINPKNCTFIFDNENSREIKNKMNQIIHMRYKIVIWPKMCRVWGKDINEIVQTQFYGPEEINLQSGVNDGI